MDANSLPSVSLTVSIAVIICMTITFAILFVLYCFAKTRCIRGGVEDETIKAQLIKDYDKYIENNHPEQNDENFQGHKIGYCEYLDEKKKKLKVSKIITDVVFVILIAVILAFTVCAIVFRVNGEQLFIGNTAYMTVQTGSMAEKNTANPYYQDLPDNQIKQYALVGIDKTEQDGLALYDVVAFKADGKIYVHRIVEIIEVDGVKHYTTMGDANNASMALESDITFDSIIGKYNGYQSFGAGCLFIYLNSNIGIIALIFALLFVLTVDISEWKINRRYEERMYYIAGLLDGDRALQEALASATAEPKQVEEAPQVEEILQEEPVQEPEESEQDDAPTVVAADDEDEESTFIEGGYVLRYDRSFTARITKADDTVKNWYSLIKNELLSYPKVRASMSWRHESFMFGRDRVARLVVRGRTLCIYLALDPQEYTYTRYKIEDASEHASLGELKTLYRIKNERRVKYTLQLIADVMAKFDVEKGEQKSQDWYIPFENDAALLNKKLIKRKIVKVLGEDAFWANQAGNAQQVDADGVAIEPNGEDTDNA